MAKFVDLAGQRFGKLTVIKFSGMSKWKNATWECLCDCGNTKIIRAGELKRTDKPSTRSCGCLKLERRFSFGESSFTRLYRQYRKDAERKGRKFDLSKKDVKILTSSRCHYCGQEPSQIISGGDTCYGYYTYNGIDRVDSTRGYEMGNVVSCCIICNIAKHNWEYKEFKNHIQKMYTHWAKS